MATYRIWYFKASTVKDPKKLCRDFTKSWIIQSPSYSGEEQGSNFFEIIKI